MQAPGGILVSDVETERVAWLWRGWLALGKLSVLDGDPGLGKSAVTLERFANRAVPCEHIAHADLLEGPKDQGG